MNEGKERGVTRGNPPQPGVANYLPQLVIGFPHSISPSAATNSSAPPPPPQFYAHGDEAGPGYPVLVPEEIPTVQVYGSRPRCGIGIGWSLDYEMNCLDPSLVAKDGRELIPRPRVLCTLFWFILGIFLAFIPWHVGAIMLRTLCHRQ